MMAVPPERVVRPRPARAAGGRRALQVHDDSGSVETGVGQGGRDGCRDLGGVGAEAGEPHPLTGRVVEHRVAVDRPPEVDHPEHQQEQQRHDEGELDGGGASVSACTLARLSHDVPPHGATHPSRGGLSTCHWCGAHRAPQAGSDPSSGQTHAHRAVQRDLSYSPFGLSFRRTIGVADGWAELPEGGDPRGEQVGERLGVGRRHVEVEARLDQLELADHPARRPSAAGRRAGSRSDGRSARPSRRTRASPGRRRRRSRRRAPRPPNSSLTRTSPSPGSLSKRWPTRPSRT